uniref:probable receptor-like protein kinase At2g23200 n=1 Tax=Erigeron canadensis TaxID=72917 RepID=UPI001CB8F4BC|nr:probable receptor-like protein kinase At2g23200 [Erigeron canadensis]
MSSLEDEFQRSLDALRIPFEKIESATLIAESFSSGDLYRAQLVLQSEEKIDILVRAFEVTQYTFLKIVMIVMLKHENISPTLHCALDDSALNLSESGRIFLIHKIEANGNLAEHLSSSAGSTGLTWPQRLSICIGVGQALKFIHDSDFGEPGCYVIHGNIKSSQILLDDEWQPKLQGFESAMVAQRNTLFATNEYNPALQHKDPAYEKSGALTDKSDVFSYGVVLFEVLFGRNASSPPPNEAQEDDWNFAEFARSHCKNKTLDDVIDPDMRKHMDSDSIQIFSKVACACLTEQREERPNMDKVVRELENSLRLQKKHVRSLFAFLFSTFLST